MKAYVRIQSSKTIQVTCGLQNKDVTNPDAHVADRLKISPSWPTCSIVIKKGVHAYPSEITTWNTVKALVDGKVLTIGEFTDSCEDEPEVKQTKETLILNMKAHDIDKPVTKEQKIDSMKAKLADIAGE